MLFREPAIDITTTAVITYANLNMVLCSLLFSPMPNANITAKQPKAISEPMSLVLIVAPEDIDNF